MKTGTEVILKGPVLKGPVIDYENSAPMCITALTGIYPWVMAARFGIASGTLEWSAGGYRVWCPEKLVEFEISPFDDAKTCEGGCPAESKVP